MAAKLFTVSKKNYTRHILLITVCRYYLSCAHDITEHIQAQLKPESACKRNWLWYNSVNTVKPCKTYNRCAPGFQGGNHGSWDAYAFRTPVPALNAKYLPPNVFMNTCHGENRAAAALYHAGGLGSTRVVWHTCRRLYACPTSQCAHVRTVTMQARQHLGDSHTHHTAAFRVQRLSRNQFDDLPLRQVLHTFEGHSPVVTRYTIVGSPNAKFAAVHQRFLAPKRSRQLLLI